LLLSHRRSPPPNRIPSPSPRRVPRAAGVAPCRGAEAPRATPAASCAPASRAHQVPRRAEVRRCRAPPPPRPARRRPARLRCRGAEAPRARRLRGSRDDFTTAKLLARGGGGGYGGLVHAVVVLEDVRGEGDRPPPEPHCLDGELKARDVDERVASVLTETESGVRSSSCILSCTFRFVPVISAVLCEWLCSLCSFHPLSRRRSAGAPNFSLHLSCRDPECDHLIATMLLYLQVYCDGSYVRTSRH
jgi:hypothetical protein